MRKELELKIGLAINNIAVLLDRDNFSKIKEYLDRIEDAVVEDRDTEDDRK